MSKNSKKYKKVTIEEERIKNKINEKFEIMKKHKIILWLILFMPVGLYKCYKYGLFNKWVSIIIGILVSLVIIACVDVSLYPNRVADEKVKEAVSSLGTIGEPRYVSNRGYAGYEYIVYDVITTKGKYNLYIKRFDKNRYVIDGIYQIIPNREVIQEPYYLDEELKEVFPEIVVFFKDKENEFTYGVIESVLETEGNQQKIQTTVGIYLVESEYDGVTLVQAVDGTVNNSNSIYIRSLLLNLPKDVEKFLKKNAKEIGNVSDIIEYNITESSIEYIFGTDEGKYFKLEHRDDGTIILYDSSLN